MSEPNTRAPKCAVGFWNTVLRRWGNDRNLTSYICHTPGTHERIIYPFSWRCLYSMYWLQSSIMKGSHQSLVGHKQWNLSLHTCVSEVNAFLHIEDPNQMSRSAFCYLRGTYEAELLAGTSVTHQPPKEDLSELTIFFASLTRRPISRSGSTFVCDSLRSKTLRVTGFGETYTLRSKLW